MSNDDTPMTIGELARRLGIPVWKVRRLYERGLLPEPARIGIYRMVSVRDIPTIKEKLRVAGYLPPD